MNFLMAEAAKLFDKKQDMAGIYREGHAPLAPIAHMTKKIDIIITIDKNGKFLQAEPSDEKGIVPATEQAFARSGSTSAPFPLCEQLKYLSPSNTSFFRDYLIGLYEWMNSDYGHPMLEPVYKYVKGGSIIEDLTRCNLIKTKSENTKKNDKLFIAWKVTGLDTEPLCIKNNDLMDVYTAYYMNKKYNGPKGLCMITGETDVPLATHFPKGPGVHANAKIISANDMTGFTCLGRFINFNEVFTIGYVTLQKAHNMLCQMVDDHGVLIGKREFIFWTPAGGQAPNATVPLYRGDNVENTEEYRAKVFQALVGYGTDIEKEGRVLVTAFDSATPGRMAVTYHTIMRPDEFLKILRDWDISCCWNNGAFGVQSPSLYQIVNCAYGTEINENEKSFLHVDPVFLGKQTELLLSCKLEEKDIPLEIRENLIKQASSPKKYSVGIWKKILFTACAVINRHYMIKKGVKEMAWSLEEENRSFQFGRLLAVMEWAETSFYIRKGKDSRQTNAIKYMSDYRLRPMTIYERVNRHLQKAYIPRISGVSRMRYNKLKEEIVNNIAKFPQEELNKPLDDVYLIGYELQKTALYTKTKKEEEQKNNN